MISDDLPFVQSLSPTLFLSVPRCSGPYRPELLQEPPNWAYRFPAPFCSFHCVLNTVTMWLFPKFLFHQNPNYDPLKVFPWTFTLRRIKSTVSPLILTLRTLHNLLPKYFSPHLSLPFNTILLFLSGLANLLCSGLSRESFLLFGTVLRSGNEILTPDPRHTLGAPLQRPLGSASYNGAIICATHVTHRTPHFGFSVSRGMCFTPLNSWRWWLFMPFSIYFFYLQECVSWHFVPYLSCHALNLGSLHPFLGLWECLLSVLTCHSTASSPSQTVLLVVSCQVPKTHF